MIDIKTEFTDEEVKALDVLEGAFGAADPAYLNNLQGEPDKMYPHWIAREIRNALILWSQFKYAQTVDWEAEMLRQIEEQKAKMAARSQEVRENLVSGLLSGLIPKARRAGQVEFLTTDECMEIVVWKDGIRIFWLDYDREDSTMSSSLNGSRLEMEDWSVLGGNRPPKEQSPALKAVVEYLEGLGNGTLV